MGWLQKSSLMNVLAGLFVLTMLTACGDESVFGGASTGNPGGNTGNTGNTGNGGEGGEEESQTISISLQLVSANTGQSTQTITSANPGRVIATASGISAAEVVSFATTAGEIPVATAITNGSNQAVVDILAGSSLGAGTITATISPDVSATMAFAVGATNLRMGSGTPFQENVATVGVSQISAGGTTVVFVSVVDETGSPFLEPVDVNFSSSCSGQAIPTATLSSPVRTVDGVAASTYLAKGCAGDDSINITANAGGVNLSATATVNVLPADVGSIEFVSATPNSITLKGTGGAGRSETSVVVFKVVDEQGMPVANQDVDFALNSTVGGLALEPAQAKTSSSGEVQTVVQAGTVSTSVRVTATVSTTGISTQSDQLVVTTGIPDQNSFSLSALVFNPEAWNYDGETVSITARLADRFNNPVPDGTAITFTTDGGSIEGSCTTTGGACSVNWTSQDPRPCGQTFYLTPVVLTPASGPNICVDASGSNPGVPQTWPFMGQPYGGRATIVATAVGEESFIDTNGNGVFDSGDTYTDLPEAWLDEDEDGARSNYEVFMDFDEDGNYDGADGMFNGVLCNHPTDCSTQQTLNVRETLVLVMSGSSAYIDIAPGSISVPNGGSASVTITLSDLHNQPLPAGSTLEVSSTYGSVVAGSNFKLPSTNHNGALSYYAVWEGTKPDEADGGLLVVKLTTPKGLVSTRTISVSEAGP